MTRVRSLESAWWKRRAKSASCLPSVTCTLRHEHVHKHKWASKCEMKRRPSLRALSYTESEIVDLTKAEREQQLVDQRRLWEGWGLTWVLTPSVLQHRRLNSSWQHVAAYCKMAWEEDSKWPWQRYVRYVLEVIKRPVTLMWALNIFLQGLKYHSAPQNIYNYYVWIKKPHVSS